MRKLAIPLIFRRLLLKAELDRAVFFGLLAKIWGLGAGPVTAILIAIRFTPVVQGYYYTFANLLALQTFAELGLGTVIIQFASHEWSRLSLDSDGIIVGDSDALSRLVSLAGIATKWYSIAAILAAFGLSTGGYFFFSGSNESHINWILPWLTLCLLTGTTLSLVPIWSLLEGCNQVKSVYTYRFFQGLFSSVSVWIAILLGAGIWTASVSSAVTLTTAILFLKGKYGNFLKTLITSRVTGPRLRWRKDILPMQWRIALSWISGYFVFSLFTPVLFKFHGPVIAGQMGMTWNLINVVGLFSSSWISPKAPRFGMLIAQKKFKELDHFFWRIMKISGGLTMIAALVIWCCIYFLYRLNIPFAARLLPPLPTGLFLLAQLVMTMFSPLSVYMRAHKMEPLMLLSVVAAISIGLSTLFLGRYYSATGMAIGYLSINLVLQPVILLIFNRFRARWHT